MARCRCLSPGSRVCAAIRCSRAPRWVIALDRLQPSADAVVMCAAVADLRRAEPEESVDPKLPKNQLLQAMESGWELVPDLLKAVARQAP